MVHNTSSRLACFANSPAKGQIGFFFRPNKPPMPTYTKTKNGSVWVTPAKKMSQAGRHIEKKPKIVTITAIAE